MWYYTWSELRRTWISNRHLCYGLRWYCNEFDDPPEGLIYCYTSLSIIIDFL